ncbi:hypothetical protein GT022_09770 [Agaribacter marinus]|uniref:Uncharacterized protein n=1 Tax=Virgibacillus salarius TaxID=447199 RepID=A0A941DZR6_9BACI|nr:hypothetical protein [Virgibacillus salarius]MBR7796328.1 hypothetical protein [Virgibacillus salarius]NAZ09037.1 hypothetical protein [Agaribacter marinus]
MQDLLLLFHHNCQSEALAEILLTFVIKNRSETDRNLQSVDLWLTTRFFVVGHKLQFVVIGCFRGKREAIEL